jgi:hypothetical protein
MAFSLLQTTGEVKQTQKKAMHFNLCCSFSVFTVEFLLGN